MMSSTDTVVGMFLILERESGEEQFLLTFKT